MTQPARFSPGSIGANAAVAPAASHEFEDVDVPRSKPCTVYVRTTQVGTLTIERFNLLGAAAVVRVEPMNANEELAVRLDAQALGQWRFTFTNAGGANANVSAEVIWEL